MSKGIRLYFHCGEVRVRNSFNHAVGMSILALIQSGEEAAEFKFIGIGTEEGALVVHYRHVLD